MLQYARGGVVENGITVWSFDVPNFRPLWPLFTRDMLASLDLCEAALRLPTEVWENEGGAL